MSDLCDCAIRKEMAKLLFLLAALNAVFTVGELAGILRKQFIQEPLNVKGEGDAGEPLFLTPYIKKKDYRQGIFILPVACDVINEYLVFICALSMGISLFIGCISCTVIILIFLSHDSPHDAIITHQEHVMFMPTSSQY